MDDYTRLFIANVIGVFATGIAAVALALLAFDLAGDDSGVVLGTALSLKMAVNVFVPQIVSAYAVRMSRRTWLVVLNIARAAVLSLLPLVQEVYQVFVLIVLFEIAAAVSRAAYLAIVPDMLPDEAQYARAVAKARIAYNAESMLSPLLAAGLLVFVSFRGVFLAAVLLFFLGAAMMARVAIPDCTSATRWTFQQMLDTLRTFTASPMLRGALAINAAATTIYAMVAVNTVVLVRGAFDLDDRAAAFGLAAFGAGGIAAALLLPKLVAAWGERPVMMRAGVTMAALLVAGAGLQGYWSMLGLWFALGGASTLCQLPIETILRRMTESGDRQSLYAAYYGVTSAFLLVGYLAAGWVGAQAGMISAFFSLGLFSAIMIGISARLWPLSAQ